MATIVTRAGKGSTLTWTEADANFTNLNTDLVAVVAESAASTAGLAAHLADTVDAHDASAISNVPAGNIVATTVQAAIDELDGQDTTNLATVATNLANRTGTSNSAMWRNRLHNGDFKISQRGGPFTSASVFVNNDAVILLDRWRLLADGADTVDVSQETSVVPTNGAATAIALDVETANRKFGIIQWIEKRDCADLIGGSVTLSFKAKVSATTNLDNVKCAIIAWSSTADAPTADAISAWGIEGTNPTLVANMTYENTPANLSVTTSYATYSVTATVDTASTNNIGVFIWSDVTTTSVGGADILYITDVQLEAGTTATAFERKPHGVEEITCRRYYNVYGLSGTAGTFQFIVYQAAGGAYQMHLPFPIEMRAAPASNVNGAWVLTNSSAGPLVAAATPRGATISGTATATGACGWGNNSADDYVHFTAEI